jgi:hypothetical protein
VGQIAYRGVAGAGGCSAGATAGAAGGAFAGFT